MRHNRFITEGSLKRSECTLLRIFRKNILYLSLYRISFWITYCAGLARGHWMTRELSRPIYFTENVAC